MCVCVCVCVCACVCVHVHVCVHVCVCMVGGRREKRWGGCRQWTLLLPLLPLTYGAWDEAVWLAGVTVGQRVQVGGGGGEGGGCR